MLNGMVDQRSGRRNPSQAAAAGATIRGRAKPTPDRRGTIPERMLVRGLLERSPDGVLNLVADELQKLPLTVHVESRGFR